MSAPSDTSVQPFRPGIDDAEALALRAEVWGADHAHSDPGFFRWLFGPENPAGPGRGVMLRRSGRLVGFAGLCPRLVRLRGNTLRMAHGLDYMVSPGLSAAASGRFALRVAAEWAALAGREGFAFGVNFPNANSRRLLTSDRLGWQPLLVPVLKARPLVPGAASLTSGSALRRIGLRLGLTVGAAASALRARVATGRVAGALHRLDLTRPEDAALTDALWSRLADARPCGLVRDAAALRWRYAQHPIYRYNLYGWQSGGRLEALVVTTERTLFGMTCLLVVDALIDPERPQAAAALIGKAIHGSGAAIALAQAAPSDGLATALSRAGFATVPQRFNPKPFMMVTLPLQADTAQAIGTATDWRFAWGDMDVV